MVEEDEREVITQAQAGNEKAFRRILDQHANQISKYVRRMTPNATEAEDIVQETFLRFWTSRNRYDPDRVRLTTWLHRIAHNLVIDSYRRLQREQGQILANEPGQSGPDKDLEQKARARLVQQALMQIPERQRSAIVLSHYQNFSNREAAEILDISVDALESLLRRGRVTLKQLLAREQT